ncbi:hypothetical protein C942_04200 [Photobacterium marinum]|uniref:Uncharacterized protein n=1 Tax=Photobacterium marinum TaxID=1056511 RepID=L8JGE5_9GAMM|nr:hypothetical protein C942_04200 [Photobacterium marinum]
MLLIAIERIFAESVSSLADDASVPLAFASLSISSSRSFSTFDIAFSFNINHPNNVLTLAFLLLSSKHNFTVAYSGLYQLKNDRSN